MPTRRQCTKCPWKISTDPHDIPNEYSEEAHARLNRTIAEPGALPCGNFVGWVQHRKEIPGEAIFGRELGKDHDRSR